MALLVFQFDGAEVFSGFENACNAEKRAVAMLQEWEQNPDHPLKWCGNFHPGANGHRPDNILSCGGTVCILFGGMRLLNSEEKERSKEVQARGKAEREAKKKTKREPARAAVRTGRLFCSYLGEIPPNKSGWWTNNRAVAGDLY